MMMQIPEVQTEQQSIDLTQTMLVAFWTGIASAVGTVLFNTLIEPTPRRRKR